MGIEGDVVSCLYEIVFVFVNFISRIIYLSFYIFLFSFYKPKPFCKEININQLLKEFQKIGELLLNKVHRNMNASWKICSLAVNGQSFLVIDGYLLNSCMKRSHFSNNITPSLGFFIKEMIVKEMNVKTIGQKLPQDAINPAHGSLQRTDSPSHGIFSFSYLLLSSFYLSSNQFLRDQASDREEVVTPLMLDGTYLSRNYVTNR